MKKGRQLLSWTPELLLIAETILYWYYSSPLNPIAISLLAILVSVLIFKNKILGFATSILFLVLNLYMCLALFSELTEFSSWTDKATKMLLAFGTMFGIGIMASIAMLIKWERRDSSIVLSSS